MELRVVQTFLCAYELNSFTKAADKLGYTQSTITIQIQQLEEELGAKLFDRIGKKTIPTEQGLKFYEYANELIQLELKAKQTLSRDAEVSGPLRLGITESLLNAYISRLIPIFREKYPSVFLDIKVECSDTLIRRLKQNEYDMVMVVGNKVHDKDCENLMLWQESGAFLASVHHPLSQEKEIPLDRLLSQPMILSDAEGMFRESLDQLAEKYKINLNTVLQVNDSRVIMDLIEQNIGISYMPEYIAREKLKAGTVVKLPAENCDMVYYTQILQHKRKWQCLPMKSMLEVLKENIPSLR